MQNKQKEQNDRLVKRRRKSKYKKANIHIEKAGRKTAMRDFDARKFDFITKLSNPVQLEY